MDKNVIDQILLAPGAVKRWMDLALKEAEKGGYNPEQVPDERAEVQEDGSLLLYCDLPNCRVSMTVPPGEWSWLPSN